VLYFNTRLGMKKILVIDDEEWLREMIQLALQQHGFEIIEAANGVDGIELARKELPEPHPLRHQHGQKWTVI